MMERVDALIDRVMKQFPGVSAFAQARYYEEVHQELAPLAREIELQRDRLLEAAMPLRAPDVVLAILAVDAEAARRGGMFPQTADEQREDRRAVARVVEMLQWYEKNTGCARIKGWPSMAPTRQPEVPHAA